MRALLARYPVRSAVMRGEREIHKIVENLFIIAVYPNKLLWSLEQLINTL